MFDERDAQEAERLLACERLECPGCGDCTCDAEIMMLKKRVAELERIIMDEEEGRCA